MRKMRDFALNILLFMLPKFIWKIEQNNGELYIWTRPEDLFSLACFLKKHTNFAFALGDILSIDYPQDKNRFHLVYNFLSVSYNFRVFVKVSIAENAGIDSICPLFGSANWLEREIWDMHGIFFYNHPDLRRILTDYGFNGFPLRKDFPLSGYAEIIYDEKTKQLRYQNLELSQEFRNFDFISPWEQKGA